MLQFVSGPTVPFLDLPFGWSTEHSAVYLAAYIGKPGGGPTQFKGSRKGRRRWPRAVAARKKCASAAFDGSKARAVATGGESGVKSSPRSKGTVAFIGACTHHAKNTFKDPPPPFLAARLLEIDIQKPWSTAPAV